METVFVVLMGFAFCAFLMLRLFAAWARRRNLLTEPPPVVPSETSFVSSVSRPRWSLLPTSIGMVVDVLSWSEQHKHGNGSWRTKTATHHYDAAMRHLHAYRTGEKQDPDTKQHPLAHAVARLLFAIEIEQTNKEGK